MVNLIPTIIRLAQLVFKRKFPSVDKPLRILAPPKISLSKRAFEKYKTRGLFSEFYGIFPMTQKLLLMKVIHVSAMHVYQVEITLHFLPCWPPLNGSLINWQS